MSANLSLIFVFNTYMELWTLNNDKHEAVYNSLYHDPECKQNSQQSLNLVHK